jgi:subtilisin family serine protease
MSQALDDAVNRAVDSGTHFAVAAGNDNKDACSYSPAAVRRPSLSVLPPWVMTGLLQPRRVC